MVAICPNDKRPFYTNILITKKHKKNLHSNSYISQTLQHIENFQKRKHSQYHQARITTKSTKKEPPHPHNQSIPRIQ